MVFLLSRRSSHENFRIVWGDLLRFLSRIWLRQNLARAGWKVKRFPMQPRCFAWSFRQYLPWHASSIFSSDHPQWSDYFALLFSTRWTWAYCTWYCQDSRKETTQHRGKSKTVAQKLWYQHRESKLLILTKASALSIRIITLLQHVCDTLCRLFIY